MQQTILKHLEALVNCYPVSSNQAAVKNALEYCGNVLRETGSFKDVKMHVFDDVRSLTASTRGTKRPKVLLQAHIDVVPAPATMQKLRVKGDQLKGRGVFDMLFAAACFLAFVEAQSDQLADLDLGLMLTGDEELGGFAGVGALIEAGYGCEVCILPDAGNGFGDLNVAAKGVFSFDLRVKGKAHHGARPWEGDGAANKLVLLLHEILKIFDDSTRENSTLTITRLAGGDADNKGPSETVAHLDIRYRDNKDYQHIRKHVTRLAKQYGAVLERIDFADDYQLDIENTYVKDFLKLYEQHTGAPITHEKAHGSSDARFFSAKGMPVIMLRPEGSGAHGDEETLSLSSLMKFYDLIEEYILKTAKIK